MDFRTQSSRNVFGIVSRSTVHLCSRWHMHKRITQLSQKAIWHIISSADNSHMWLMRSWWTLQATPTDTGMCCSFNLKSGLKDGKYKWAATWLASPSKFSLQTDPCWPSKLFSSHCCSGELPSSALIWEIFAGASSDDPSTWFWQGELVKIDKRLKCTTYTRVSHLSLTVTRTKCLRLQWQKTSKVRYSPLFGKLKLSG